VLTRPDAIARNHRDYLKMALDPDMRYSVPYMLTTTGLFSDGRNQPRSNYAPRTLGSSASRILARLDGTHHGVRATPEQKRTLRLWIDSGAPYPGTYAALGTGMIGGYAANGLDRTDSKWPSVQAAQQVERVPPAHHDGLRSGNDRLRIRRRVHRLEAIAKLPEAGSYARGELVVGDSHRGEGHEQHLVDAAAEERLDDPCGVLEVALPEVLRVAEQQ
jgi:hypothetical protein